jgi:hypothetical protein
MKGYWENLRPFERRVVVGVGVMLFAIFNLWFVLPHFSDLSKMRERHKEALEVLAKRQEAVSQIPKLQVEVNKFQKEGLDVPAEEQALQFARTITDEEVRSGVNAQGGGKIFTETNLFFLEQTTSVHVEGNEQQLIDFLFNLGSGNSLIRVRELTLHPDPSHQKLSATVKLVASYQKSPSKPGAAPAKAVAKSGASPGFASKSPQTTSPGNFNQPMQPAKKASK